jgi:hypothetical protein
MKPIKNKYTTTTLGAPKDWDESKYGPCIGLPVACCDDNYNYSYWSLTWRERLSVLFGRPIRLCVLGWPHPPVMLDTTEN